MAETTDKQSCNITKRKLPSRTQVHETDGCKPENRVEAKVGATGGERWGANGQHKEASRAHQTRDKARMWRHASTPRTPRERHGTHEMDDQTKWGVGGAISLRFAREGYAVALFSRKTEENISMLAKAVSRAGGQPRPAARS